MKQTTIFLVAICLLAVSCGPRKPSIALSVYPEILGNDTLYFLKATVTNESPDSIFICDKYFGISQIKDINGRNKKDLYGDYLYYDYRMVDYDTSILTTNKDTFDEIFFDNAVNKDIERTKRLNFFLKDDSVLDNVLMIYLEDRNKRITILGPYQSIEYYSSINFSCSVSTPSG